MDPLPAELVPAWERFISQPGNLKLDPVSGVCEALFTDGWLFPLQRKRELAAMLKIAASVSPRVVMEVGADRGGGAAHLCMIPGVKEAIINEIRGVPYWRQFHDAFPRVEFLWLGGVSSYESSTVERAIRWLGKQRVDVLVLDGERDRRRIDVLFLDGDKANYLRDLEAYLPMMSATGVILMHDVQDQRGGPYAAFTQAARMGFRTETIIDTSEAEPALERQRQGIPPLHSHDEWLRHWHGTSAGVGVIYMAGRRER